MHHPHPLITDKSTTSFHFALQNITDETVRTSNDDQIPILELVTVDANMEASRLEEMVSNDSLEVNVEAPTGSSSITCICPILHKKLDLVCEYLIRGKNVDIPFTPYPMKKHKKQLSKLNSYNTQSKGEPKGG